MPHVEHPEFGKCRLNNKGYPRINAGPQKDEYLHRAVWERIAERALPAGFQVHHMNGKLCWCPHQLVALPEELHPPRQLRCPYTGQFLSQRGYEMRGLNA